MNNNLDNLFKEGLGDFEMTPSEKTREAIESRLFAAEKPVPFFLRKRVLAAIVLLLLGIGGWYLYSTRQTDQEQLTDETVNRVEAPATPSEPVPTVGKNNPVNNESASESIPSDKSAENNTATTNQVVVNKQLAKQVQTETVIPQPEKQKLNETIFTKTGNNLDALPYAGIYSLITLSFNETIEQNHDILTVEQYIKKRNNLHFYTGLTAQAGMIYYPSTKDQFTYGAEADFGLKAGKFYFETGVGYRHINEQGNYKINFKTEDSVGYYNHVTSFEINPQNPDQIILNYKKTTVYDSVDHIAYTAPLFKYDYLTVPLRVGYRVFNRDNFFVALEGGVEYSRLVNSYIPDNGFYYEGSDIVQITNNTPERVTNNWKYMLSVRVGIRLNHSISIIAQPEFSKYFTSVYTNQYDPMKPYMMNLRAGIYFDF